MKSERNIKRPEAPEMEKERAPVSDSLITARLSDFEQRLRADERIAAFVRMEEELPGARAFLVGGTVRDVAIGETPKDFDFVVCGAPLDELVAYLGHHGNAHFVGEKRFGVIKFTPEGTDWEIDVALPRQERSTGMGYRDFAVIASPKIALEDDLRRRDFTINAMALDVKTGELVCHGSARNDMLGGIIRAVDDPAERFAEDPSRMLRGIRFAAKYNFRLHTDTMATISALCHTIDEKLPDGSYAVSREKIGIELLKMMDAHPVRALDLLKESGLLARVLPEIARLETVQQYAVYHPEGNVYIHTRKMLKKLPPDASLELKLSVLFHDAGKYTALQITLLQDGPHPLNPSDTAKKGERIPITDPESFFKSGNYNQQIHRVQNIGHDPASVEILNDCIRRLSLTAAFSPNKTVNWQRVRYNVKHHLMQGIKDMSPHKAERLLFDEQDEPRWDLVALAEADAMTADTSRSDAARAQIEKLLELRARSAAALGGILTRELMKQLLNDPELSKAGFVPGQKIAAFKEALREAELEGTIQTQEDVIAFAHAFARQNP